LFRSFDWSRHPASELFSFAQVVLLGTAIQVVLFALTVVGFFCALLEKDTRDMMLVENFH